MRLTFLLESEITWRKKNYKGH